MEFDNVLSEWGINISSDKDLVEQLFLSKPKNCYLIDRFPLLISSFKKFEQEEISYDRVLNNEITQEVFKSEEMKFINIIKKLWLYNQILVETNFLQVKEENLEEIIEFDWVDNINDLRNTLQEIEDNLIIDNINYLNLLIGLGTRERVVSILLLLDFKILIYLSDMCFFVYFKDISKIQLIKEIVCTEGLYLRPYIGDCVVTETKTE